MNIKLNYPNFKFANNSNMNILWELFKEYHDYIYKFKNEQKLPFEKKFIFFWQHSDQKLPLIFFKKNIPIGFCLLQILNPVKENNKYIEVGAVFLKKDFRKGFNGINIYNIIIDIGKQLCIPIRSEIASDNHLSITLVKTVAKGRVINNLAF